VTDPLGTTLDDTPDDAAPAGRRPSPGAILAVVGFSVFVAADDLTVVSTMLRPIIGDLGLVLPDGIDDAAWIVNAYLIAFVAVMPIAGRISDVIGRRRTFVGAYLLFIVGTILIPWSVQFDDAFGWFLFGRVLTAIGGGAMVPVALAVVGDVYPEGKRARALGTLGAIETMGWVWGPLYGAMLVRFLSWEWQFWLNIPFAIGGLAASWWALEGQDRPDHHQRLDWIGALLLTITLVSLNMALLGSAEIQSVNGLDELTGGGTDLRWLYIVAVLAGGAFVWEQSKSDHPLFDARLFRGRNLLIALAVNFVVGAGLVIAMVDVPLFINAVEVDLERAAVYAGWTLSAMTAAMAIFSYLGGRATEKWWYRPPVLAGLAMSTGGYAWMGATWSADTSYPVFALQLALLGGGFGLTVAPTTSAVVDAAPHEQRGSAAAIVMVVRLLGLSVGLSALTAWGLARFNDLRSTIDLPGLTDPDFQEALIAAQESLTAQAIAETFTAAAVVIAAGLLATFALRPTTPQEDTMSDSSDSSDSHDETILEPTQEIPVIEAPGAAPGVELVPAGALAALHRRTNLMIGLLATLLVGAFITIALLFGRVADARDDARAAQAQASSLESILADSGSTLYASQATVDQLRDDIDRVEAGAALYASQIEGFQEQIVELEPQISAGVDEAITGLREFGNSTIAFDVNIDEVIPIDTEVVIRRTVAVPIQTEIPIKETIDTTITIDTFVGNIPLDITVPVDIVVPIDLTVDIPIDETVPIKDEFPVKLDVPIAIDVRATELASLTDSLAAGLESLQDILTGLGG
jgi:EmrB/QacA subfamily drug resistance transporter